jgi:hypothetical protein
MRRKAILLFAALAIVATAVALLWPPGGSASVSIAFTRYGTFSAYTNLPCGFFVISNTSSRRLLCRGVGASSGQQLTQVLSQQAWVDTDCWRSPGAGYFYLSPGQSREVPVPVETNLSWRIRFRFRETGFVDRCPWFVWRLLPAKARSIPDFHETWTEAVPAYAKR